MREIKFRGLTTGGNWVYGDLVHGDSNSKSNTYIMEYGIYGINSYIKPETIGEFTGLKDKNGKEIYEGDLCKWEDDEDESYFQIIWGFNAWRKQYFDKYWQDFEVWQYPAIEKIDLEMFEVFGNVYENPELLEGENGQISKQHD